MDWKDVGELTEIVAIVIIFCLVSISWVGLITAVALTIHPLSPEIAKTVTVSMAALLLIGKFLFYVKFLFSIFERYSKT